MDLEQKFKEETGFDAYIDNNLEPKIPLGYYVEWLEEQLIIPVVSNSFIQEIERRRDLIISEPKGIVRELMIRNIALEL